MLLVTALGFFALMSRRSICWLSQYFEAKVRSFQFRLRSHVQMQQARPFFALT